MGKVEQLQQEEQQENFVTLSTITLERNQILRQRLELLKQENILLKRYIENKDELIKLIKGQ